MKYGNKMIKGKDSEDSRELKEGIGVMYKIPPIGWCFPVL